MKPTIYVFGFDNTLVNSEDLFVDCYNKVFNINITKEHWYEKFHCVTDQEKEFKMIEEEYHIKFTPESMKQLGELVVKEMPKIKPIDKVFKLVKENEATCHFLTGSPLDILKLYFKAWNINISEDRLHYGIYNGSGKKEKILKELLEKYNVIYLDDDVGLIKNAKDLGAKVILIKQVYNKDSWDKYENI